MQEVNKAAAMLDVMMDEISQKFVVDGAVEAFLGMLTCRLLCLMALSERRHCDHDTCWPACQICCMTFAGDFA